MRALHRAEELRVKLFADGADLTTIARLASQALIKGFTTNPTLMRKAGVTDYRQFARDVLAFVPNRPVSFEVFSDEFPEMEQQALEMASWGENVYVKIPVTNTRGAFSGPLIKRLSEAGIKLNVTAVLTSEQVGRVTECFAPGISSFISVFAGRIADTGRDPVPLMAESLRLMAQRPQTELIWASPRELLNVIQADAIGCHSITATNDILAKLPLIGKDLSEFSLETVRMFRQDALRAGLTIELSQAESAGSASARP